MHSQKRFHTSITKEAEEYIILIVLATIVGTLAVLGVQAISTAPPPWAVEDQITKVQHERRQNQAKSIATSVDLPVLPHTNTPGALKIKDASPAVFAYAHGTAAAGGKFVVGMANRSGNRFAYDELIVFTDPEHLDRFAIVTLPHVGDVETMVYDAANDKVHFLLTGNNDLELYTLDPHTLRISLVASSTALDVGRKPAIATDGTYVYGITDSDPSSVFKIRLADGTLTYTSKDHMPHGHSAAVGAYGSSTELYFGNRMNHGFEKDDAADLSVKGIINIGPCSESDDMPYMQTSSTGGYVYIGCEMEPYGYRISTSDMSAARFSLPGASLGMFIFGSDLYNAARDGTIDVFPHADLADMRRYRLTDQSLILDRRGQDPELNELFYSPVTNSIYFTAWWGVPGLYRVATSTEQ